MYRSPPREVIRRWGPLTVVVTAGVVILAAVMAGGGTSPGAAPETTHATPPTSSVASMTSTATTLSTTPPTTSAPSTTVPPASTTTVVTTTTLPTNRLGGSITLGLVGEPVVTLNPFTGGGPVADAIGAATQGSAWRLDPVTLDYAPELVTEVPSLSNGGLIPNDDGTVTVRLTIRDDARWSDGFSVVGEDFRETARQLAGVPPYDAIDPESWTVGRREVEFTFADPSPRWYELFAVVLPSNWLRTTDAFVDWEQRAWPVAGPFVATFLDAADPGGGVRLSANPTSWRTDAAGRSLPLLDEIVVIAYPDRDALIAALAEGEVDVAPLGDDYVFAPLPGMPEIEVATAPGPEFEHLGFQLGDGRFDRNPRSLNGSPVYRNLVALLVDREGLAAELGGVAPLDSVAGASWPAAASSGWPDEPVAPGQARAAVAEIESELGYDFDDTPPEVRFATTNDLDRGLVAGVITQELASGGMLVDVALEDPGVFFRDYVLAEEFDLAEWAWDVTPGPAGAVADLSSRFGDPAGAGELNLYGWSPELSPQASAADELLAEARVTMDQEALRELVRRVDGLIAADMVVVPLFQPLWGTVFVPEHVVGVNTPVGGLPATATAATWEIPPGGALTP